MTKQTDEIAALKARVAELERKAKPPEPFKPDPNWRPYDPTAGMSMPLSALAAMVNAEPRGFMAGVVRDNRGAPTGPTGAIPRSQQQPAGGGPATSGSGTGWAHETPIGPPPGLRYVDAQLDAQDARDRAERVQQEAQLRTMEKMTEQSEKLRQQTEALAKRMGQTRE
jgi:hypothetical protein